MHQSDQIPNLGPQVRIRAATVLKALGHPARLHIVELLAARGELTVSELAEQCGLDQPALSQHATVLRHAGIVTVRRDGTRRHYALAHPRFIQLLQCISTCRTPEGDPIHG